MQQPWAWAIIHGGKDVENRTQAWKYRGPLAIHAGVRWSERGSDSLYYQSALARETSAVRHRVDLRGAIIGVVDLVDAHQAETWCCDSPWGEQSYRKRDRKVLRTLYHLVLANPRAVEPISMAGKLGLWDLPDGLDL